MGSFRLKPKWIPFCINCPSGSSFWVKQLIYKTHFWWPHLFLLRKTESLTFPSNSLFKWGSLFLLKVFVVFRCVYIGRAGAVLIAEFSARTPGDLSKPSQPAFPYKHNDILRGNKAWAVSPHMRHLHISHNEAYLPPKILHKHCFQFLLGRL